MQVIIFFLIAFIIEVIVFLLWFKNIYKVKRKSNLTIYKILRNTFQFYFYLRRQEKSEEVINYKIKLCSFFYMLIFGIVAMLVLALVIVMPSIVGEGLGIQLLFMIMGIGVIFDFMKKYYGYLSHFFDEYSSFLYEFQKISHHNKKLNHKDNSDLLKSEVNKSLIDNNYVFWFCFSICLITAGVFLYYSIIDMCHIKEDPQSITKVFGFPPKYEIITSLVFVCIFIFLIIADQEKRASIRKKLRNCRKSVKRWFNKELEKPKGGIVVCEELMQWEAEILQMCKDLQVDAIQVIFDDDSHNFAYAKEQKYEKPSIVISRHHFIEMGKYFEIDLFKKVWLFIIGHELAHIHFFDTNKDHTMRLCIRICLGCLIYVFGSLMLINWLNLSILISLWVVSSIYIIVSISEIIDNRKYWGQIQELRADRIGMEVSHTSPDIFDKFALYYMENLYDREDKKNIIYTFYEQYIDVEEHPDFKRRSAELHRGRKWGITEHLRYSWLIRWQLWMHRGWKL